jgi:hypothetical protein
MLPLRPKAHSGYENVRGYARGCAKEKPIAIMCEGRTLNCVTWEANHMQSEHSTAQLSRPEQKTMTRLLATKDIGNTKDLSAMQQAVSPIHNE